VALQQHLSIARLEQVAHLLVKAAN
jgi:hypothetical protein